MSDRVLLRALVLVVGVAAISMPVAAQIPEKFENLQVLPKDVPRDTLVAMMRGFTMALGVRCQFCHVEREPAAGAPTGPGAGGPFQNFTFKADDKDNKKIARVMLRMMDSINTKFLVSIPNRDDPPTNVNCATCHRGLSKPGTIETVLLSTTSRAGVDSAITRYRGLRNDMASGKYNFGEQPVSEVARKLSDQGKYNEAIALLQMNQEFYPSSVNIDFQLADTYVAKGDTAQGVTRLRAVLTKNPNDRRAQAQLRRLGVQP